MKTIHRIRIFFAALMVLSGLAVFSYPFVSNYLSNRNATVAVEEYSRQVEEMQAEDIDAIRQAMEARNRQLNEVTEAAEPLPEAETYLDYVRAGSAIGYITIPVIDVNLPLYEGTTDDVLARGIGHIVETSYPVGGEGTHAVLSGHRGLAEAELFTNLDKLQLGNRFYLHVLDDVLAYQVDQIMVVEPEDTADLVNIVGQDLCTLVTCTPIGINSHRLLVRGHRVEYTGEDDDAATIYQSVHLGTAMQRMSQIWPWLVLVAAAVLTMEMVLCMMTIDHLRRRMEED